MKGSRTNKSEWAHRGAEGRAVEAGSQGFRQPSSNSFTLTRKPTHIYHLDFVVSRSTVLKMNQNKTATENSSYPGHDETGTLLVSFTFGSDFATKKPGINFSIYTKKLSIFIKYFIHTNAKNNKHLRKYI